jgi:hypothetical protein
MVISATFALMMSPAVQLAIGRHLAGQLSKRLQTKVEIGRAYFSPVIGLVLKDVTIEDHHQLPFVRARRLVIGIHRLSFSRKTLHLSQVKAEGADVNVVKYAGDSILNITILKNRILPPDTAVSEFGIGDQALKVNQIEVTDTRFLYMDQNRCAKESGMDYHFIEATGVEALIYGYVFSGDSMQFEVKNLSAHERSGLVVNQLQGHFRLGPKHLIAKDVILETPQSYLDLDFSFLYNDWFAWDDFIHSMYITGNIRPSHMNMKDLGPFATVMYKMDNHLRLSGEINGTIPNLQGKNLVLQTGNATFFKGNVRLTGLPQVEETFIQIKATGMSATIEDLENIRLPGNESLTRYITLPQSLKQLGFVSITGQFTGFYNDFVSNARFVTGLGSLTTDLRLRQETDGRLFYQGGLSTSNFYLGKILNLPESIGKISLTGKVEGRGKTLEDTWMQLDCDIQKFELYGYSYQNSKISGEFDEKKFTGNFSINDPGLKLDFDGLIDLGGEYAEFDFTAQIAEARVQKLNLLHRDDSLCNLQFNVRANFIATHFDDLEGVINITNLQYLEKGITYRSGKALLSTTSLADGTRTLNLLSDFADMDLRGRLFFTRIPATIAIFVSNYLNTFRRIEAPAQEDYSGQNFTYTIKLKDIDILTGLFLPWMKVSHNSFFRGNFDSFGRIFRIEGGIDTLTVKNIKLRNYYLNAQSLPDRIALHTGCRRVILYEQNDGTTSSYGLDSLQLVSNIRHDSIHYSLSWDDDGPLDANIGRFKGFLSFTQTPHIENRITSGSFHINDSAYVVEPGNLIRVSTDGVYFENIHIHSKNENLRIDGSLGKDSSHVLQARFENFNLSNADLLLSPYQIDLDGLMTGNLKLYRHLDKPVLQSGLKIEGFAFNEQKFGKLSAQTRWDPSVESLYMDVSTEAIGKVAMYHPIRISGFYYPFGKSKTFDLKLETKAFNLKALAPFAEKALSDLSGNVTANLRLGGTLARPELKGEMNFTRTEFRIKFLNTQYDFSGNVTLDPQKIHFDNIELNDSLGNKAICTGRITHNYLRNAWFDIRIRPNTFLLFNILPGQNKFLHGTGFASGLITAQGTADQINLSVAATTNRGTEIFIPLSSTIDIQGSDFIHFKKPAGQMVEAPATSTNVELTGFNLSADMRLTPNAKIQISLPQQAGTIESQGEGNISLGVNSKGDLSITGDYEIQSGSFLFKVQNILSRVLEIEKGSTIRFPGNPMDAEINLRAAFTTRTTLTGLGLDLDSTLTSIRMPVKSVIRLKNKLINPEIKFSIEFPKLDTDIERMVFTKLDTTNDMLMTQQFVSLLVLNNFSFTLTNKSLGNSIGVSSFQVISNQLSNLLSQISKDFDIGVNYRPGDAISSQELELALRTQLFDERVTIDGNLGVIGDANTRRTSNVVGDINVEVKLSHDGRFRLRAFNRSNNLELLNVSAPYTQGIGLFYREDFNTLGDLFRRKRQSLERQLFQIDSTN